MTQLCEIPGCRLRGRHKPGCGSCPVDCACHSPNYPCSAPGGCGSEGCGQAAECDGCLPRATDDGRACDVCVGRAASRLETIVEWTADARLVAAGLVRRGSAGGSGKPASRPPLNDEATDAVNEVEKTITALARHVADTRGLTHGWRTADPLIGAAAWLLDHQMDWIRHAATDEGEAYAAETFPKLAECASKLRWVLDGPSAQRYLGPCGAEIEQEDSDDPQMIETFECDGDVYGRDGAEKGTCRTCKAEHDQGQRRIWLDEQVSGSDLAWTARGIADALNINVKTVREWARAHVSDTGHVLRAARLATYYRLDEHIVPWTNPAEGEDVKARGPRLHYVSDVRELAKEMADRRASEPRRAEAAT